jgi:hypothetical protein
VLAIVIALHTAWGRDYVRRKIEHALAAQFPGGARIGELTGSVFGVVELHDIELDGPDGAPELVIRTARIDLALWPLLGKRARIDKLELDDVTFTAPHDKPGAAPSEPAGPSEPSAWSVDARDIAITHARVGGGVDARDIEVHGALAYARGVVDAHVSARGTWRDRAFAIGAVARYDGDALDVPVADVAFANARADATGARLAGGAIVAGAFVAHVPAALSGAPDDIDAVAFARDGGIDARVASRELGAARVVARATLSPPRASGIATVGRAGDGALVAFVATPDGIDGIATATRDDARAMVAFAATSTAATASVVAAAAGVHATGIARLSRRGAAIALDDATLRASAATFARADVRAADARVELHARGTLTPALDVRGDGTAAASRVARGDVAIANARVTIDDARYADGRADARGRLDVAAARVSGIALGGGAIVARVAVRGASTIDVALDEHDLRTPAGRWRGRGGAIAISADRVAVREIRSTSGRSSLAGDASYALDSGDLVAHARVRELAAATLSRDATGTIGGTLAIARTRGSWRGDGDVVARALAIDGADAFDGRAKLRIAGRRVVVRGDASSARGRAELALDLDGPRDLADVAAWRRLERRALREARVRFDHVDTGTGIVDGELAIGATDARADLDIRDVPTRVGAASAHVALVPGDGGELVASATVRAAGIATPATVGARFVLPAHPFDPRAWRALGRDALHGAEVRAADVAIEPSVLAALGVATELRGRADVALDVLPGARAATAVVHVRELRGEGLARPVDVALDIALAGGMARAIAHARDGDTVLATVTASVPFAIDRARAVLNAPLDARVVIPPLDARDGLALVDRRGDVSGSFSGTIDVTGTIAAPRLRAQLVGKQIAVPPSIAGRDAVPLDGLAILAEWDGTTGDVDIVGRERGERTLHAHARGRPSELASMVASIDARSFDLAPLAAFAPSRWSNVRGTLDGTLELRGFAQDGEVRGELRVHDGRIPIAPQVGTIARTELVATIAARHLKLVADGRLGAGDVHADADVALDGAVPDRITAKLRLRRVSPIGAIQPIVSANATATLARRGATWSGDIVVRDGVVVVPPRRTALHDAGAPDDMTFVGDAPRALTIAAGAPLRPWLVANVAIEKLQLATADLALVDDARGVVDGNLIVSVGDTIGIKGSIAMTETSVELFGRRYVVDRAAATFDGTPEGSYDPELDISIHHDFPDLVLRVAIRRRASDPELIVSSDPAKYTPGQLLGFVAGGEPGGDPSSQTREAAAAATASLASTLVKRQLNRLSPIKLDVIGYQPATSSTSAFARVGKWWSRRLYTEYRQHVDARPDENAGEGVFEYYFKRDVFLQGTAGDRGYDGADLLWRHRW